MAPHKNRRITGLVYEGANSIDISGPLQVFDTANSLLLEANQTKRPA